MSSGRRWISATIALLLIPAINQMRTGLSDSNGLRSSEPRAAMAVLTVLSKEPITINGAKSITGATVLSGAEIETPVQVRATVEFGSLGVLNLAPNTRLKSEFAQDGHLKVTLDRGCMKLRTWSDAPVEVLTPQGVVGQTNPNAGGSLQFCFPQGGWPEPRPEYQPVDGLLHLGAHAVLAVIGGRLDASTNVGLGDRGANPGPSAP